MAIKCTSISIKVHQNPSGDWKTMSNIFYKLHVYLIFFVALFVLLLCPFDISVGVGAFVIGLSQISSFFSWEQFASWFFLLDPFIHSNFPNEQASKKLLIPRATIYNLFCSFYIDAWIVPTENNVFYASSQATYLSLPYRGCMITLDLNDTNILWRHSTKQINFTGKCATCVNHAFF